MSSLPDAASERQPDHPIETIFLKRWSPRAMTGEAVPQEEVNRLLEAARWAPSTYNEQEWRFLYAHRDTPHWNTFFELLVEGNQAWCKNAGALFVVASHQVFALNGKPNPVHTFDAGSAFENFALQGAAMGLVVHGMMGFDQEKARRDLQIPDDYSVDAMIAVGRYGNHDQLPEELKKREVMSGRKPISEISCQGPFAF